MEVTYTMTADIDLDRIASMLSDDIYDILDGEYGLSADTACQVFPQILDELWKRFKEHLEP